jgi:hypothetical protein
MNYDGVIFTDRLADELFGQASREGMLPRGPHDDYLKSARRTRSVQNALSLFVLFDRVLVPVFHPSLRIPVLEDTGIVRLIPFTLSSPSPHLRTRSDTMLNTLERIAPIRPFVLAGMAQYRGDPMGRLIAETLHAPREWVYGHFIDLALAFYRGRRDELKSNPLYRLLPRSVLPDILSLLESTPRSPNELSSVDNILLTASILIDEVVQLLSLSNEHRVPVATIKYSAVRASGEDFWRQPSATAPLALSDAFAWVRYALTDTGQIYLPRIDGIAHALRLRRDPHLRALREHLALLQSAIARGDVTDATTIRKQVGRAVKVLNRARRWQTPLRWASYMALPITTIETLLQGLPIGSFLLGVPVAGATAWAHIAERKHEWALFGK